MIPSTSIVYVFVLSLLLAQANGHALKNRKRQSAQVFDSCVESNAVALTFDDGPWQFESDVTAALAKFDAKGTFFLNGDNFQCIYDPDMVANITSTFNAGHQLASHTWQHLDLTTLSFDDIHDQMFRTELALQKILGVSPAFMRPPFGSFNDLVQQVAAERNQSLVIWDFDSGDSVGATVEQSEDMYTTVAQQRPDNLLALNHEVISSTVFEVLPFALQTLSDAGYKFVTVAECLGMDPYKADGTTFQPGTRDDTWTCNQ